MLSFRGDLHDPGRASLYGVSGGHVTVDYGHNPGAYEAVCRMASLWTGRRGTGIIAVPGDRDESATGQARSESTRGREEPGASGRGASLFRAWAVLKRSLPDKTYGEEARPVDRQR